MNVVLTGEPAEMEVLNTPMCLSRAAATCEIAVPLRRRRCTSDNQKHLPCRKRQGGEKKPALLVVGRALMK